METVKIINLIIAIIFTVCYSYQFFYIPIPWLFKRKNKKAAQRNSFAVLICGRNESAVIGDLLESINNQTYDSSLITTFVMADNCTDNTAEVAKQYGAVVYERFNTELVGKGYALSEMLKHIKEDYPEGFDGYFVFDADNILSENYIEEMNKTFSQGHDVITSYRNSKNYGDNWISAGYALWFLRESRYLNNARFILHTSCAVSGTGFMFSRKIAEEVGEWPFHMLTEDIEFSVNQISQGRKIAFCKDAELYDEQPVKFSQSWRQRLRWSKGYLQVYGGYGTKLLKGIFKGWFSCYDMFMTIMPAFMLSIVAIVLNVIMLVYNISTGQGGLAVWESVKTLVYSAYGALFIVGAITTVTEWKHIHTSAIKKIFYAFTFPIFMFTYIPISIRAFFGKCTWKPIEHTRSVKVLEASKGRDKKVERRIIVGFAAAFVLVIAGAVGVNAYVSNVVKNKIVSKTEIAEKNDVDYVIVFAGENGNSETRKKMVYDRIVQSFELADTLSKAKLLVFDERAAKIRETDKLDLAQYKDLHKVENERIIIDSDEKSIYDSLCSAKEKYGAKNVVIVTQECHLSRTLYIAKQLGIEACGVAADTGTYEGQTYRDWCENFARIRDFAITLFDSGEVAKQEDKPNT